MPDSSLQDRIHPATPRKRKRARADGQVANSADLTAVIMLIGALIALSALGGGLFDYFKHTAQQQLHRSVVTRVDSDWLMGKWYETVFGLGKVALPILIIALALPIVVHLVQTRFLFRLASVAPDWSRTAPSRGFQRIFSGEGAFRSGFGTTKAVAVGCVVFVGLYARRAELVGMAALPVDQIAGVMFQVLFNILIQAACALLVLALLDYFYQRWKYERELMMTTEELRDELRDDRQRPEIAAGRRVIRENMTQR